MSRRRNIFYFFLVALIVFSICEAYIYFYIYPHEISAGSYLAGLGQTFFSLLKGEESNKTIVMNLHNLILDTFEDGKFVKRYKIIAAGHPRATPTPQGNFQVLEKRRNVFSNLSLVWMPWSIRFYKGYFIHEVPYLPSGARIKSPYSWGCVRIGIGPAQKLYEWTTVGTKVRVYSAQLVKTADKPEVYFLTKEGFKRHIPNPEVFDSYGYEWRNVVIIPSWELDAYPEIVLIRAKDDSRVYKVENGTKRWIRSIETFNRLGFQWSQIFEVNDQELEAYPLGSMIE